MNNGLIYNRQTCSQCNPTGPTGSVSGPTGPTHALKSESN